MAEHPIQGIMNVTMDKIHEMVDANNHHRQAYTPPRTAPPSCQCPR